MSDLINIGECCRCRAPMALPRDLYSAAKHSSSITFFCAHGHPQRFPEGESEETKLRRERDRLKQQLAQKDDAIRQEREQRMAAERQASAARGVVTKLKNRAAAGVCLCCNRSFANMARHMADKHPQFQAEEIASA